MHDIDQLVQQLKQDGHIKFQLLSPEEAAHLNGLVHGNVHTPMSSNLCAAISIQSYVQVLNSAPDHKMKFSTE